MKLLVILPAYNEAGKIGAVVNKVKALGYVDQILVVDDCSTDSTPTEAESAGAFVIRHESNQGVGAGIRSGIEYGRRNNFEIAAILSGDDQHEPTELADVVEKLKKDPSNFIQGSRRLKGGEAVNPPLFREITTRIHALVFSILAGQRITDSTNGFRAFYLSMFDHPGIDLNQDWLNTYELEPYLLYKAVSLSEFNVVEMPITIYYRGGKVHYSKMKPFRDWWRIARPLFYLKLGIKR